MAAAISGGIAEALNYLVQQSGAESTEKLIQSYLDKYAEAGQPTSEERMAAIEDSLCELDAAVNK